MTEARQLPDIFRLQVSQYFIQAPAGRFEHVKSIILCTPCEGMNLLLSYKELKDFHQMIEQAGNERKIDEILQCFRDGGSS